jgi:hypothetical protein
MCSDVRARSGNGRTRRQLGNPVLTAEAKVTLAAGAIIVIYGIREGREHLRAAD